MENQAAILNEIAREIALKFQVKILPVEEKFKSNRRKKSQKNFQKTIKPVDISVESLDGNTGKNPEESLGQAQGSVYFGICGSIISLKFKYTKKTKKYIKSLIGSILKTLNESVKELLHKILIHSDISREIP